MLGVWQGHLDADGDLDGARVLPHVDIFEYRMKALPRHRQPVLDTDAGAVDRDLAPQHTADDRAGLLGRVIVANGHDHPTQNGD